MEPLSALGLAGNIVQFIDFGCSLISESHDIYRHGMSARYVDLEAISENLSELSDSFKDITPGNEAFQPMAHRHEDGLKRMATMCKQVAVELLQTLHSLKAKNSPHHKWTSFRQALMVVWKKDKIDALKRRLDDLRGQLNINIVSILSVKQSSVLKTLNDLLHKTTQIDPNTRRQIDYLTQSLTHIYKQQAILKSLCYENMTVRHSRIVEAHAKTFDWIFKTSLLPFTDPRSQVKLAEWLHSSEGIYWVSGKPGSGKSTFMKYLEHSLHARKELELWAQDSTLVTASFYFWNAGTAMQKSHQGLLQSILFEILNQCPGMIPSVCPELWETSDQGGIISSPWTLKSLFSSLELLKSQTFITKKYCFFIDGLDEYEGDHLDLIETLRDLARSPNIKLCVSSRPWNCYEDALGKDLDRRLRLQDLTREDIYLYAQSRLQVHLFPGENGTHYQHLISEIVNRAQGVFLWVFLVVQSLREGLANGDSISILEARLRGLPADLELFFKHIIESVDPVYQKQMALTFQAALIVDEPLLLITYSFLEEEDPDYAIHLQPQIFDDEILKTRKVVMRRRLIGRYKGLLEVSTNVDETNEYSKDRVEFLHRTVRDFLMAKDIQKLLNCLLEDGRNACFSLVRAHLAFFKTVPSSQDVSRLLNDAIRFSRRGEVETGAPDFEALDEFDLRIRNKFGGNWFLGAPISFLETLTRKGFVLYVEHRIKAKPSIVREYPLLVAAVEQCITCLNSETNMIEMLLKHGANLNQRDDETIWDKLIRGYPYTSAKHEHECWRRVVKILLLHGLDIHSGSRWADLLDRIIRIIKGLSPLEKGLSPLEKGLSPLEKGTACEIKTSIDMLFAHGANPNKSNEGWRAMLPSVGSLTLWEEFLRSVVSCSGTSDEGVMPFFLQIMGSFLHYGADPQCRIICKNALFGFDGEKERTVSEVIGEILLQMHDKNSDLDHKQEAWERGLLHLLQSEILHATQAQHSDTFKNHGASSIQAFPTPTIREDYARLGYGESNQKEIQRGTRDIRKAREGSSFRRSQDHSGGRTHVLGNPKVSKHSRLPPRRTNARAVMRSEQGYTVESYTWEYTEGPADFSGKEG